VRKPSVGSKVLVIRYTDCSVFVERYEETLASLEKDGCVVTNCQFSTNDFSGIGICYVMAIFYNPPEIKTDK